MHALVECTSTLNWTKLTLRMSLLQHCPSIPIPKSQAYLQHKASKPKNVSFGNGGIHRSEVVLNKLERHAATVQHTSAVNYSQSEVQAKSKTVEQSNIRQARHRASQSDDHRAEVRSKDASAHRVRRRQLKASSASTSQLVIDHIGDAVAKVQSAAARAQQRDQSNAVAHLHASRVDRNPALLSCVDPSIDDASFFDDFEKHPEKALLNLSLQTGLHELGDGIRPLRGLFLDNRHGIKTDYLPPGAHEDAEVAAQVQSALDQAEAALTSYTERMETASQEVVHSYQSARSQVEAIFSCASCGMRLPQSQGQFARRGLSSHLNLLKLDPLLDANRLLKLVRAGPDYCRAYSVFAKPPKVVAPVSVSPADQADQLAFAASAVQPVASLSADSDPLPCHGSSVAAAHTGGDDAMPPAIDPKPTLVDIASFMLEIEQYLLKHSVGLLPAPPNGASSRLAEWELYHLHPEFVDPPLHSLPADQVLPLVADCGIDPHEHSALICSTCNQYAFLFASSKLVILFVFNY